MRNQTFSCSPAEPDRGFALPSSGPPSGRRFLLLLLYSVFLLFSGSYLFRVARWTEAVGCPWLGPAALGVFLSAAALLLSSLLVRALRRKRFLHLLFLILILIAFFPAYLNLQRPLERFHLLEFSLLGILIFRALAPRRYSLQFYLTALNIVLVVSFFDEVCQGLVPDRYYDLNDIWVNIFSGAIGILVLRMADVNAPLPLHPRYRHEHRTALTPPPPLIDLHVYRSDFLFFLPLALILALDLWVTWPVRAEGLPGIWRLSTRPSFSLELHRDGRALMDFPGCRMAGAFQVEGNRLDGHRLRLGVYFDQKTLPAPCEETWGQAFQINKGGPRGQISLRLPGLGVFVKSTSLERESLAAQRAARATPSRPPPPPRNPEPGRAG